jgi:tetratricopeptide (TPR) repeat protein
VPVAEQFQFDVFLSHNSAQKAWTEDLARRLRDDGFKVWFDKWELPKHAGKDWIELLAIGVKESSKVVLVWSPEFFSKEWPVFESRIIQHIDPIGLKDRVIPLLHTPVEIPTEWGFRQALDFTSSSLGQVEFDFCYQQLAYNLDNTRPFEGDFERFRKQYGKPAADAIPPVMPLPKGSRMPLAANPLFVGREKELRELTKALTPGSGATAGTIAVVTGTAPGVGKTELAIQYVHRYGRLYQGGVFWLNMGEAENAQNEVALCGGPGGMDLPGFNDLKLPEQAAKVHHLWEDGAARLIVFDNAEDAEVVEEWRPKTGRCSLLITSRRCEWPPELGATPVPVETLPRGKSLELLAKARRGIAIDGAERATADRVCEQLGDLPLALSVAAAYLGKYKSEALGEYLEALRKQPTIQNESLKKVWASFTLSYDKLDPQDETDSLAMRLFHLASHFAPASISRDLLGASAGLNYSERAARHRLDDALSRLRDLALLSEGPGERILLHRLIREFARLHPTEVLPTEEAAEAVADMLFAFANQENESGLPQKLALELMHVREAASDAERRGSKLAGSLNNELGFHARLVAAYQEAKAYFERALEIVQAALGPDDPRVATAVNNLGSVLKDLGDLAGAKACYERALKIDEAALGPDHPNVATLVNNLGSVLKDLGDLAGAKACYERALKIDEAAFGADHPEVAADVNNLGGVLKDLGDLAGAKGCYERALKIDEATFGPDHPKVAIRVNNLGIVLQALGDLAGARAYFERALKIDEAAFRPDHPNVARGVNNLGRVLHDMGDVAAAKACFERALKIDEAVFGPDHPEVAGDVNNLGGVLQALGNLAAAKACYERALKILTKFLPADHAETRLVRENLENVTSLMSRRRR